MTPEQWKHLKPLFEQALEMPAEERTAFVEQIRRENEEDGRLLASLIDAHNQETDPIDQPLIRFSDRPTTPPSFSAGDLVRNRFRIVRFLGRGGMGEVYEADDVGLGRIALKIIRPEIADRQPTLLRFKQEAQLARMVTSPYVCRIFEFYPEPPPFLTMEFLDGCTLAAQIAREGALPIPEVEEIALQLCAGLQAIHDAGVIHRDFKSHNVMLVMRKGVTQAVVMDLGMARETAGGAAKESGITAPGTVMGTSEYMAPEQFEGRPATPATDIYALGVVLYEMVTRERPFNAPTPLAAAIRRAKRRPPASAIRKDLPGHWDEVIERCLEYDAERRYQSADEVAAALRHRPSRAIKVKQAVAATSRTLRIGIAVSVLLLLALGAWAWYRTHTYSPPSAEVQDWYDRGVAALREGTYQKAVGDLAKALEKDGSFALAHARLADAWAELDFTGKAQEEMLRASELEVSRGLPGKDKQYLDAVRHTLTRQFPQAVKDYAALLKTLPGREKPYGYVDLGRADEKAGDVANAQANYQQAAKLAPEYPASFVHLGILESRQAKNTEAEADFSRAESLYRADSNTEGLAEIDYQRGYAASLRGDLPSARAFFEKSLHAARDLQSAQLEIRALTRMCIVEYLADNTDKAISLANQAIELAHQRSIEYWAIEGMVRLGNVYVLRRDYAKAEPPIEDALRLAHENGSPRLEALASLSLAGVRDQQGKPDDTIALGQKALDYYKGIGDFGMSTTALTLIVRSRRDEAEFKEALRLALDLLETTRRSNTRPLIFQAQQTVGAVLLSLQRYPEALSYFQAALAGVRLAMQDVTYYLVPCAETLGRLGRYREALDTLASIPAGRRPLVAAPVDIILTQMALSRLKFKDALAIARRGLTAKSPASVTVRELLILRGLAQTGLGAVQQAHEDCQAGLAAAQTAGDRERSAEANLCLAAAYLAAGTPQQAKAPAEAARQFFSSSDLKESEMRSLLYLAEACDRSGDSGCATKFASEGLDILSTFAHNWGIPAYQEYVSGPDIQKIRVEFTRLARK